MDSSCIANLCGRTRRSAPTQRIWLSKPSFDNHPGTKKRRMLCIVVSRLSAHFQRLMLLDYQIRLNFASGVGSGNVGGIIKESTLGPRLVRFYSEWTRTMYSISGALCRIRRVYIHIRHSGRAWQPSPTRRFWHPAQKRTSANSRRKSTRGGPCRPTSAQQSPIPHSPAKSKTDA